VRYSYTVFGAGRQGVALAYDLAARGEALRVILAERDEETLRRALERLHALLPRTNCVFEPQPCDVSKPEQVREALHGTTVAISAAPYRFNALLAEISVDNGSSFCDLGGNTEIVRRELDLDARARAKGVSLVPDCGLAPGLANHLAAHAVATLEQPRSAQEADARGRQRAAIGRIPTRGVLGESAKDRADHDGADRQLPGATQPQVR
jgi:lysine 6-dehydrogenase